MTDRSKRPPSDEASTTNIPGERNDASNIDLVFKYRQQAADLRNEARRLELEAAFYSQHQEDQHLAKRNLALAREMRQAADVADDKAMDCQRLVPHNRVN